MKSLLVAVAIALLALPASADDDYIQFMGLVTFVAPKTGVEAILPRFNGNDHVVKHDALILFSRPPYETDWPVVTPIDLVNTASGAPVEETWYYVKLDSDTVTFDRDPLPGHDRPTFLPQLNDGCCRYIFGLDDDYEEHGNAKAAAHVVLPFSTLGVGVDPYRTPRSQYPRYDTVARFAHERPLTITATSKRHVRKLVFKDAVKIVIANFPIEYLKYPDRVPADDDHPHFKVYYEMANLGHLCSNDRVPKKRDACKPSPKYNQLVDLVLGILTLAKGTDINCSNSTYP